MGRTVAYRRLGKLVARRLVRAVRFSVAAPALYVATREGLAWAGLEDVDPAHVGIATARHWALCAQLAVVLERAERCTVWGEPRRTFEGRYGRCIGG
jgi:methylmalonyl-CoA mutase cobalamin-binding subunit